MSLSVVNDADMVTGGNCPAIYCISVYSRRGEENGWGREGSGRGRRKWEEGLGIGCPIFAYYFFRSEAKQSETETILLSFCFVSRN